MTYSAELIFIINVFEEQFVVPFFSGLCYCTGRLPYVSLLLFFIGNYEDLVWCSYQFLQPKLLVLVFIWANCSAVFIASSQGWKSILFKSKDKSIWLWLFCL